MEQRLLPEKGLRRFCADAFERFGFSARDSAQITDVLLLSDLYGIESHGVQRLFRYHRGLKDGSMRADATPVTVFETPVSAVIDGQMGMGQLIACHAMRLAIEKAKAHGVGLVSVRASNHFGIAGYYAKMACDQGLLGVACTNTAAVAVPTFGSTAMLGTNPIAVSMPADPYPFFFDASTTVVARGKIEVYHKKGAPLPEGWAADERGACCVDAEKALACTLSKQGGILPLGGIGEEHGGYKGYGYGVVCELFSSILSLGMPCNHVSIRGGGVSHGFAAVNPAFFGDPEEIKRHFSQFLGELRDAPRAADAERIYTHGEKEIEAYALRMRQGIPVSPQTWEEMRALSLDVGLALADYFPETL